MSLEYLDDNARLKKVLLESNSKKVNILAFVMPGVHIKDKYRTNYYEAHLCKCVCGIESKFYAVSGARKFW